MLEAYLRDMADTDRALSRQLAELLELVRQYGPEPVANAIEKASAARAFGADYVANIRARGSFSSAVRILRALPSRHCVRNLGIHRGCVSILRIGPPSIANLAHPVMIFCLIR
jgi:hypothetical protein